MKAKQKLWLSQKYHIRLSNHYYKYGAYKNKKLCEYHSKCVDKQQDLGRILTGSEKRKIYKSC